jgi:hypothetical protein
VVGAQAPEARLHRPEHVVPGEAHVVWSVARREPDLVARTTPIAASSSVKSAIWPLGSAETTAATAVGCAAGSDGPEDGEARGPALLPLDWPRPGDRRLAASAIPVATASEDQDEDDDDDDECGGIHDSGTYTRDRRSGLHGPGCGSSGRAQPSILPRPCGSEGSTPFGGRAARCRSCWAALPNRFIRKLSGMSSSQKYMARLGEPA